MRVTLALMRAMLLRRPNAPLEPVDLPLPEAKEGDEEANEALNDLRSGRIVGTAVLEIAAQPRDRATEEPQ